MTVPGEWSRCLRLSTVVRDSRKERLFAAGVRVLSQLVRGLFLLQAGFTNRSGQESGSATVKSLVIDGQLAGRWISALAARPCSIIESHSVSSSKPLFYPPFEAIVTNIPRLYDCPGRVQTFHLGVSWKYATMGVSISVCDAPVSTLPRILASP